MGVNVKFIDENSYISNKGFSATIKTIIESSDLSLNRKRNKLLYLPWWDLIPLDELRKFESAFLVNSIKWTTISHVSTHLRVNKVSRETNFLKYAANSQTLGKVFYWDTLSEDSFEEEFRSFVIKIPEYHFYIRKSRLNKLDGNLSIGFFGSQSIKRGKLIFILLALINPKIRFVGVGLPMKEKNFFPRLNNRIPLLGSTLDFILQKSLIKIKTLAKNYSETNVYFRDQKEFNQSLLEFDAIFVAGHLMPYSSGVALQSLACGVPVIWTSGNSAHSDQMKENFPIGKLRKIESFVPYLFYFKLRKIVKFSSPTPVVNFDTYAKFFITKLIT
jgi:glycosyltransferase involved in cell wall biosynthesis